ncbi:hypothetical protein P7C70_g1404, partial [Phenoliferia sp. Uapishka_3]
MACHNERVARSRKHAEAKRSRSLRRDKESRSTKTRGERSGPSTTLAVAGSDATSDPTESSTASHGPPKASPRPLPPSPLANNSSTTFPSSESQSKPASTFPPPGGTKTGPSGRTRFNSESGASGLPGSPSLGSLSGAARSAPTSQSRRASAHAEPVADNHRHLPHSGPFTQHPFSPSSNESHNAASQDSKSDVGNLSPRPSSRQGSLSAPDKASNRRSGFYGSFQQPPEDEESSTTAAESEGGNGSGDVAGSTTSRRQSIPAQRPPSPPIPPSRSPVLPELHHSMSFYDPDTLLFLNHVATDTPPPKRGSLGVQRSYSNGIVDLPADNEVERLSPNLSNHDDSSSSDDEQPRERNPKSELATKVRESIRLSRESQHMNMDVDMVELLLSELEGTRREMQNIQTKYNAFRRASRSAFEGFSMAREEYDKEVAARRDAETRMDQLRVRFAEQALKLAAVDKEERTAEALKHRSKDLRSSVVGMEKQLSQLRAEVELSTAQMEELAIVDKPHDTHDRPASLGLAGDMERSLNARLEAVKAKHRREIGTLVAERDALRQEIAELRQTREIFAEESTALNLQNSNLADLNAEAARQLDLVREAAVQAHSQHNLLDAGKRSGHHQHSGSTSSVTLVQRTTANATKIPAFSPAYFDDGENQHRNGRGDHEPRSVAKKFGWGKGKQEQVRPHHNSGSSTSKALPSPRPNGTIEPAHRSHSFQQTSILRPVRCEFCSDKMWGLNEVRCTGATSFSLLLVFTSELIATFAVHPPSLTFTVTRVQRYGLQGKARRTYGRAATATLFQTLSRLVGGCPTPVASCFPRGSIVNEIKGKENLPFEVLKSEIRSTQPEATLDANGGRTLLRPYNQQFLTFTGQQCPAQPAPLFPSTPYGSSPTLFFRKFQFASSAVSSIDSLLAALPSNPNHTPSSLSASDSAGGGPPAGPPANAAEVTLFETTLDALLATPDLLSEIKTGANPRLTDFLARAESIHRLGGWIVWGLGGDQEEDVPNGGIIADDVADGKVPDIVVAPARKKKAGMGGVPRRRDMDEMGVLEGGEPESDQEKSWSTLASILYEAPTVSSQPHTCPTPTSFLDPFWESLLRSTELQLETRSVQVGYWARVNGVLLGGPHGAEILAQITAIPYLLPRLLTLLPSCSPINDLLLLILRISTSPSPLLSSLVPSTLRMLSPSNSLGKQGHVAAEELLRGVIELCSAAPGPGVGQVSQSQQQQDGPEWRENGLARQLADDRAVKMLVDWMLADVGDANNNPAAHDTPSRRESLDPGFLLDTTRLRDLRTSSLIQSISVLVDLIRKNNSDFVEQQMLTWARRKEQEHADRTRIEAEGSRLVHEISHTSEEDRGPSLVDLGALLSTVAHRLQGFQLLVRSPRSLNGPILTSAGSITPLTLERFRICEFYAELLHCSNMSLLNRHSSYASLYDNDGFLANGWQAAGELAAAVAAPTTEDSETASHPSINPAELVPASSSRPTTPTSPSSLYPVSMVSEPEASSDREASLDTSDAGSEESDPFGDPFEDTSDADLAAATDAVDLNQPSGNDRSDLTSPQDSTASPPDAAESPVDESCPPETPTPTPQLSPGPLLKHKFMEHRVIETMLVRASLTRVPGEASRLSNYLSTLKDLFFAFPWNNFLHNVVFDILQQIFHGRIDRALDRQLALSVFLDGKLIDRILEGQVLNDAGIRAHKLRQGYMGHMTLVAEEVVKLFEHYPTEIHAVVAPHIPAAWDHYVATTLRETRERDLSPLGGGITSGPNDTSSTTSQSLSDEDDEFPMNHTRVLKAMEAGSPLGGGAATDAGAFGGHTLASSSVEGGDSSSDDRFSRYLANAMSGDRPDKFSSDEDEDEDGGWLGGSRFDPGDADFSIAETGPPKTFGFEDRFDTASERAFKSTSTSAQDQEALGWGSFASNEASDGFPPSAGFPADGPSFEMSFSDTPFDNFAPVTVGGEVDDEDDFGDFAEATSPIVLPSMEALNDFDFNEDGRLTTDSQPTSSPALRLPRPVFARTATADDGSSLFGGLASSSPTSPISPRASPFGRHASLSPPLSPSSPSVQADLATTDAEPLGPSMQAGARLTQEGFVEATVEGKIIRVPADEVCQPWGLLATPVDSSLILDCSGSPKV